MMVRNKKLFLVLHDNRPYFCIKLPEPVFVLYLNFIVVFIKLLLLKKIC